MPAARRRLVFTASKRSVAMAVSLGLIWAIAANDQAWSSEQANASWYQSGVRTANGERFVPDGMTCARRRTHFGAMLRVTDIATHKSIICRVNDRGPFIRGRTIDLSRGSARALGILGRGVASVYIDIVR